jgi:hypothetical protein
VAEKPSDVGADFTSALASRIDAIEEAYEFMLAYAAQGFAADAGTRAATALDGLAATVAPAGTAASELAAFQEVVDADARRALVAMRLVLAQPSISSQLVDNLNASIHLRTLLTDLFLLDEVAKTL